MKKQRISEKQMAQKHPYIPEAFDKFRQGRISRRDFLRMSTLLGLSAATASLAACGAQTTSAPEQAPAEVEQPAAGGIKRGGTFTKAMELQLIDHPARFSWVQQSNVISQVGEYLTQTGPDNITRPYLLESWEASDDVKTWTLNLRQGI
ncbi:MAG: twin-arginine translocation signal domain-containing protein, partial [Anaerolineae bacterium]|nr:twin-arginine translocation signal domain-containing protein [Anaerolineae bacterium]